MNKSELEFFIRGPAMTTIPDHVLSKAVGLLNSNCCGPAFNAYDDKDSPSVITVAKLLMNPPAPMIDPDEEAAKRVLCALAVRQSGKDYVAAVTEQMRKERQAWEAGRC